MNLELKAKVEAFVLNGVMALDRDDLESWAGDFAEQGRYVVLPRENREKGYHIGLMHCQTRAILEDRISVLRHANKFNPHFDRHVLSGTHVVSEHAEEVVAHTAFMVVQTTQDGVSTLFCSGLYEDRIILGDALKLAERIVVLDTFNVQNCLATPL